MSELLEPLDPELAALVVHEQTRPSIPSDVTARLAHRLGGAIPGFALPAVAAAPRPRFGWLRRPLPVALASLATGGVLGAGLHAHFAVPPAAPAVPAAPAAIVTAPPPAPPEPPPPAPITPSPAPAPVAAPPRASRAPAPRADAELARERTMIEIARAAMARGNAADCLAALRRHLGQFPHGQLVEEREALWVHALAASGQNDEARDRATRFHRAFPDSLLGPVVDAALR